MSTFDENQRNRQSAGTSIGGQFANKDHPANDGVGLGSDAQVTRTVDKYGSARYRNPEGQLHRTDGAGVEYANGNREWWLDGQLHRTDGPAIESANGNREWWMNDKLHREDGPAIEYTDGGKEWWLDGREVTEEEHRFRDGRESA